jgi:K+-transporting ATPase ATPase A chain
MAVTDFIQIGLYFSLLILLTPLLGGYMAGVFSGERTALSRVLGPLETRIYRVSGIDAEAEMRWTTYAGALLIFNVLGIVLLFGLQLLQSGLPLNPAGLPPVSPAVAFNTAVSFVTNTNWQAYSGESTLSYLTQMVGLTVQNFVSAATGIAVLIALTRALARRSAATIGNFWVDLVRATLYVLLPLSLLLAVLLMSQGVVQSFQPYVEATTLSGQTQVLPLGPAASQIAIKQLGTNGGGFFGVNSAHPFENPTPLSNLLQMLSILLIPAALTSTYGVMIGSKRQGWTIFAAMCVMLALGLAAALLAETSPNPAIPVSAWMEGKEVRFGISNSVLWATATTAASNGSVNAMHDSLMPLGGLVLLLNMMVGEVIFGGVGAGLYGMLIFIILTVFIAGLMVGRTPEYLGKKIDAREIKMAILAVLAPNAAILLFTALGSVTQAGLLSRMNGGPHGFSEILYAFTSAAANNGSAFAGLNASTDFYAILTSIAMLIGRYGVILPVLAIAGSMVGKKVTPPSPGTFATDTPMFAGLLIAVILIVGALTFFPSLTLGPIAEHFLMMADGTFALR